MHTYDPLQKWIEYYAVAAAPSIRFNSFGTLEAAGAIMDNPGILV